MTWPIALCSRAKQICISSLSSSIGIPEPIPRALPHHSGSSSCFGNKDMNKTKTKLRGERDAARHLFSPALIFPGLSQDVASLICRQVQQTKMRRDGEHDSTAKKNSRLGTQSMKQSPIGHKLWDSTYLPRYLPTLIYCAETLSLE